MVPKSISSYNETLRKKCHVKVPWYEDVPKLHIDYLSLPTFIMSIPEEAVVYKDVSALIDELGVDVATTKILRKRLEHKYKLTFSAEGQCHAEGSHHEKIRGACFSARSCGGHETFRAGSRPSRIQSSKAPYPTLRGEVGGARAGGGQHSPHGAEETAVRVFSVLRGRACEVKGRETPGCASPRSRHAPPRCGGRSEMRRRHTTLRKQRRRRNGMRWSWKHSRQAGGVVPKRGATKKGG